MELGTSRQPNHMRRGAMASPSDWKARVEGEIDADLKEPEALGDGVVLQH